MDASSLRSPERILQHLCTQPPLMGVFTDWVVKGRILPNPWAEISRVLYQRSVRYVPSHFIDKAPEAVSEGGF